MTLDLQERAKAVRFSRPRPLMDVAFALSRAVLFVLSVILLSPTDLYKRAIAGLDPSWNIGIQLAFKEGLTFGRDIIFTYGPLGFLATRLPIGASKAQYLVFDILVIIVTTGVLLYVFRRLRGFGQLLLAFLAVLLLSTYVFDYPAGITTFLFMLFVFLLLYDMHRPSWVALVVAAMISLLVFYIKLNAGLPALILMLVYLLYQFALPRQRPRSLILILAAVYLAAIVGAASVLNTDLPQYLVNSLYIVSGHNEAMYLDPGLYENGYLRLLLAVVVMIGYIGVVIADLRSSYRDPTRWLSYGLVGLFLVEIFKHSFTRADMGHSRIFFLFAPAMLGLLYFFLQSKAQVRLGRVFFVALVFSAFVQQPTLSVAYFAGRFEALGGYARSTWQPMDDAVPASLRASHSLPEDVLALIGDAGIDIMPWEISYLYANDLTYNPRPIIHSYDVYGAHLDEKNAAKYSAEDAPTYVLFFVGDIDERLPFATESHTKLAILANYEVIRRFDQFLLLRKRAQPRQLLETTAPPQQARLGETIALDRGGVQLLDADIGYTPLGRLVTTLYQPPPLNISVIFPDGQEHTYRAVRGIVDGGMIVNPFVDQLEQADLFFDLGQGRQVAGIRFESPAPWAYRNEFSWQIKQVELQDSLQDTTRMKLLSPDAVITPTNPNVLFDGWHPLESQDSETCRWSDGTSARLFFRVEPFATDEQRELTLEITAGTHYTQTIPVLLNGAAIGVIASSIHWDPAVYSFAIDPGTLQTTDDMPRVNELEFLIPDAMSPASLNDDNGDTRVLGLCLWQMNLRR